MSKALCAACFGGTPASAAARCGTSHDKVALHPTCTELLAHPLQWIPPLLPTSLCAPSPSPPHLLAPHPDLPRLVRQMAGRIAPRKVYIRIHRGACSRQACARLAAIVSRRRLAAESRKSRVPRQFSARSARNGKRPLAEAEPAEGAGWWWLVMVVIGYMRLPLRGVCVTSHLSGVRVREVRGCRDRACHGFVVVRGYCGRQEGSDWR